HVQQLTDALGAAEQDRAALAARVETVERSLTRKDGAGALLAAEDVVTLGSLAAMLQVQPGEEEALAAALGALPDAVAGYPVGEAVDAIRRLREDDAGRASFVVATVGGAGTVGAARAVDLPSGARCARDLVTVPASLAGTIDRVLADVVVVDDLAQARALL